MMDDKTTRALYFPVNAPPFNLEGEWKFLNPVDDPRYRLKKVRVEDFYDHNDGPLGGVEYYHYEDEKGIRYNVQLAKDFDKTGAFYLIPINYGYEVGRQGTLAKQSTRAIIYDEIDVKRYLGQTYKGEDFQGYIIRIFVAKPDGTPRQYIKEIDVEDDVQAVSVVAVVSFENGALWHVTLNHLKRCNE